MFVVLPAVILLAVGAASAAVWAATSTPSAEGWTARLPAVDGDDVNVAYRAGRLRLASDPSGFASERTGRPSGVQLQAPHVLAHPANRVRATITADRSGGQLSVDVRGQRPTGWTEWLPVDGADAVFGEPVSAVQVRLILSAESPGSAESPDSDGPAVRALRLRADTVEVAHTFAAASPLSYRVFATREGLVGGTTANGHIIVTNDHFVALPSRRGLSARNTGDYTVRVCSSTTGRCEYAPVWDVGPWNTKDDYWNPAATRQSWRDLPQGRPEAQAAYSNGYNSGRDQFGRTVANPAGIDLADGTFRQGLALTTNAWVTVTYLWTGSGARGRVNVNGTVVNVRSGPSTSNKVVGVAAAKATVLIECQAPGPSVTGPAGTSKLWDRIGPGNYISHAFLTGVTGSPPAC